MTEKEQAKKKGKEQTKETRYCRKETSVKKGFGQKIRDRESEVREREKKGRS